MLNSIISNKTTVLRYTLFIPMLFLFTYVVASKKIVNSSNFDVNILITDTIPASASDITISTDVDEMPRFPGCENMKGTLKAKEVCAQNKLLEHIFKNLKYPKSARDGKIDGQAIIQFRVKSDGLIDNVTILKDPGAGLGEAAKDVILTMNKMKERWIPGMQKGVPVNVVYTVPLKFKIGI